MFACPCHYKGLIDVLRGTRNAIALYVAITFSPLLKLSYLCLAVIPSIRDVIINTLNRMSIAYPSHARSYRCPTCSRALINMDHYFRLLDVEVRRQPMPPPYDSWQTAILWYAPYI